MSSGSANLQVKKVLKSIVDKVVSEFEANDSVLAVQNNVAGTAPEAGDSENNRRSARARKEPDRLVSTPPKQPKEPKEKKQRAKPFKCELVMDPPPADLRGILKVPRVFPPPRKSSLSATAGKTILNKYRKVRVSRRLHYKVIPPLPGWRADRTRMPEDEPDEEEKKRLEEQEEADKKEAQRKKRKRKSIGVPTAPAVSDDDATIGADETSGPVDPSTPGSPDVYYEDYMKVNSPDSVLATDSDMEERGEESRRPATKSLFDTIEESPEQREADAGGDTVAKPIDGGDTVAREGGDTVAKPAEVKKPDRRRSVRIQPPEEEKEKPKAAEKKERRKSKMFPVTPMKEPPVVEKKTSEKGEKGEKGKQEEKGEKEGKEVMEGKEEKEEKAAEKGEKKSVRRRSGVVRLATPAPKQEEEAPSTSASASTSTRRRKARWDVPANPYNDDPCRPAEEVAAAHAHNQAAKTRKVTAWLARPDAAAAEPAPYAAESSADEREADADAAAGGEAPPESSTQQSSGGGGSDEVVETARGSASHESQLQLSEGGSSGERRLVEAPKAEQAKRKGRRSMKFPREVGVKEGEKGEGGKENLEKEMPSRSSKSEEESKRKKSEQQQAHPFFAKFAPKSSATTSSASKATVAATVPEKKPAAGSRRRSMFVPKKSLAAKKEGSPVERRKNGKKKQKEEEEGGEDEDEEAIEIVGEVRKEEKKKGSTAQQPQQLSGDTTPSMWRSSEIDAAPYAGLVHVGRDPAVTGRDENANGEEEEEGVVRKMRRLSVRLPRLSSYSIPSSVRDGEKPEAEETVAVFDGEREQGQSDRAASLVERARDLAAAAADATVAWPEAMRPRSVEECVGDKEVLSTGKRWLQKWKKRLDAASAEEERATKAPKAKRKKRRGGAYSDEEEMEDSDPDFEPHEECRLPNPLLLCGPIGCGKTAYLRALSSSCGFSLLESAPDERRAGSNLRAKLAGAVANYRMSSKAAGGIASFFSPKNGGDEKKKEEKEEEERKGRQHTLVVIEHVDVIFADEDRLFWPALAEILATTKIPIALTCNVVPDELSRVLAQAEEAGGAEHLEMVMDREGAGVEEYVEASLAGSLGRSLSSTVIPAIAARARADLRAALHDAHWAAAGPAIGKAHLTDRSARRVDAPAMCDAAAAQSFAWRDACARRAEKMGDGELSRAAHWPARRGMPGEVYARLCKEIDEIDQDASRQAEEHATRVMEQARSGVSAGNKGRSGLLTRREIAEDWMPLLEQIDRREQEKRKEYGRRHQHYFNVIRNMETGLSIDPLDRIKGTCAFFRLPQSEPQ